MFFDGFTDEELTKLERVGQFKTFKKDDELLKEGENGTAFAIILKGKVEVRKSVSDAKYRALVELAECDLIGELGFFGAPSRTASIVALEDTEVLEFSKKKFEMFTDSNVEIGLKVYRNMARILAGRLTSNDSTLMDTIVWAMAHPDEKTPKAPTVKEKRTLKILRGDGS